jgi:hypothetical protein
MKRILVGNPYGPLLAVPPGAAHDFPTHEGGLAKSVEDNESQNFCERKHQDLLSAGHPPDPVGADRAAVRFEAAYCAG